MGAGDSRLSLGVGGGEVFLNLGRLARISHCGAPLVTVRLDLPERRTNFGASWSTTR